MAPKASSPRCYKAVEEAANRTYAKRLPNEIQQTLMVQVVQNPGQTASQLSRKRNPSQLSPKKSWSLNMVPLQSGGSCVLSLSTEAKTLTNGP